MVLDNFEILQRPTITLLVGIPGSGKTSLAEELIHNEEVVFKKSTSIHISSDAIRKEIYGDEGCQNDPARVFSIMQERTLEALNNGCNVIYDATNITRKNRKEILDKLPPWVVKKCVICWAPIEVCIERDKARERTVGEAVIDRMLRRFEAPYYDEGFTEIYVNINKTCYNPEQYIKDIMAAIDIPHDNPHHSLGVLEHCKLCGKILLESGADLSIINAGFIHDIGKAYTKTFKNRKGEEVNIAHYYDHQAVGAWLSYGIEGSTPTLAWLVSTHMAPFINQKYHNSLPEYLKKDIDALHAADKAAH